MTKPFVHLHNHTEYSLLDGAQRIPEMVARAKELGMPALAITDHGAMFGVMEFYLECRKQGVKPIIGMEAYVAPEGLSKKDGRVENSTYHLLLLAKNQEGYRNLCKLATISSLEGFYYKPRIDHDVLRQYASGLISTTTCLGSEVNQALLEGDYDKAQRTAGLYKEIFGEGNYFVELQDHNLKEQQDIKDGLLRISRELDLPLVCTNDSHYLCKTDHPAHDVLLCIQTGAKVADKKRMRFETEEFYLKSPEEMATTFADTPDALSNCFDISEFCDVDLERPRVELPDPNIPGERTANGYMTELAEKGLAERFEKLTDEHWERLRYEISVIEKTGFEKYMLLVREFAQFTREQGIYFGVRGSAAGSLVSYCLGITDIDPIEYGLTFERFLNPERIAMPDIDMDFEDARREEVIQYVRERFGEDRVAQIITFGTLGAKQALRDAGRALQVSPLEVDQLCKLIPQTPGTKISGALEEIPELKRAYMENPTSKNLIDTALSIEGISRHYGVHAAGVVISKDPLAEVVPLAKGSEGQIITQFPMNMLEKAGLLKMDFLGLSNLSIIAKTIENIEASGKGRINIQAIPDDDKESFEMIGRGETVGMFQLESSGMTRYVQELKPQNVGELSAMVALFRPGPMEHIPRYIRAKFGVEKPEYLDPRMEPILSETFGVIVYQDQVLHLVRALAGFSLGEADILRKAMGKKDKKAMAETESSFLRGAIANGMCEKDAKDVFDLLRPFAGYAFNKAHSVCYATIAYQTAYLKTNYPVEYMAALLGAFSEKEDRVVGYIEECRRMEIEVLPPDVHLSQRDFAVEDNGGSPAIRFGLGAIKGVGSAAVAGIIEARKSGTFTHLFDLALRTRLVGGVNKAVLEALIKAGALTSIEPNQNKLLPMLDTAAAFAEQSVRDTLAGQSSLFDGGAEEETINYPVLPEREPLSQKERLAFEKEVLGLYISSHPLMGYEKAVERVASHTMAQVQELEDGARVTIAGVIVGVKQIRTRSKNELMATATVEDVSGQATVTVFPSTYAGAQQLLVRDRIAIFQGHVQHRERKGSTSAQIEVIARSVEELIADEADEDEPDKPTAPGVSGYLDFEVREATQEQLERARELMRKNPGEFCVRLQVGTNGSTRQYLTNYLVSDGHWLTELRRSLEQCFVKITRK
jgi:DNA polymerase-3 subunit alpha